MTDRRPPAPTPRRPPDITGGADRYEALLEVLEQERTRSERDRELERQRMLERRSRGGRGVAVLAALSVVAAWLWVFPPSILVPSDPPPPPIEEEEAAIRVLIQEQALRINAYRAETGRLPVLAEEAGEPIPGVDYVRLNPETYQLRGSTDRLTLTYASDLPLGAFVGQARATLGLEGAGS